MILLIAFHYLQQKKEKNYFKYFENQNTILRFKARLNTSVIEDVDRRFLISFFLCDDTIQIFELTNKNSGIMEGKFLERKNYKNVENDNKKFSISDFEINRSIIINSYSFHIIDADNFTKKWLLKNIN